MKNIILFLFLSIISITVSLSQNSETDTLQLLAQPYLDQFAPEECSSPSFKTQSIVEFETSMSLFLKFEYSFSDNVKLKQDGFSYLEQYSINSDGILIIDDLPKNKSYTLFSLNGCGDLVPFFSFRTSAGVNTVQKDGIIGVSRQMFDLVTDYAAQDIQNALPLYEYLNENDDIHKYEKMAFYQKKIMLGNPFSDGNNGTSISEFPRFLIEDPRDPRTPPTSPFPIDSTCNCSKIQLTESISPGGRTTSWWRKYTAKNGPNGSEEIGSNSENKWSKSSKGAAKNQRFFSHAWKNKPCALFFGGNFGSENPPSRFENMSTISLSLICNDYNELPSDCNCRKKVIFNYNYESKVEAFSKLHKYDWWCGSDRASMASAKDMAVVYCEITSKAKAGGIDTLEALQIIDAMELSVGSACSTTIDTSFFDTLSGLADSIYAQAGDINGSISETIDSITTDSTVVLDTTTNIVVNANNFNFSSGSSGISFGSTFNPSGIIQAIGDVMTSHFYVETNCNNTALDIQKMTGSFTTELVPNKILRFITRSHANTGASGRRSWLSWAETVSNFAMTVVVTPGLTSGNEAECCSPWSAIYSGGAFNSPLNDWENRGLMGGFLHDLAMDGCYEIVDGHPYTYGDFGSCARPSGNADCPVVVSGPGVPKHRLKNDFEEFERTAAELLNYSLLDITGREIPFFIKDNSTIKDIEYYIRFKMNLFPGFYFFHILNPITGEKATKKIFIP